jgi:hypothetical protein
VREREPASQRRLITLRDCADALAQIRKCQDGFESGCEAIDQLVGRVGQLIVERLHNRRTETVRQTGAQDNSMCDPVRSDHDLFVLHQRLQRGLKMGGLNPAGLEVAAIQLTRKIPVAAHELFAAPDGLFKRKVFQTVKRVVMHEGAHRPVLRDDFTCEMDNPSQFHPSRFDVGRTIYLFHLSDSVTALVLCMV